MQDDLTDGQHRELVQAISDSGGAWTRRRFLITGAGAVTVFALGACGEDDPAADQFVGDAQDEILNSDAVDSTKVTAPQPPVLTPDDTGLLKVIYLVTQRMAPDPLEPDKELLLRMYGYTTEAIDLNDPLDPVTEWAYSLPGPTLRFPVQDGVTNRNLQLALVNGLTSYDTDCDPPNDGFNDDVAPNCFHGPDITNMHYHGSHVSPSNNGDNVLIAIEPGASFANDLQFTETQPPGTHWYHPHKHGATSVQVGSGMSGALIIDGDFDVTTIDNDAEDLVFVMQEVRSSLKDKSPKLSINGTAPPITINMQPGEIQRWRFVNAAVHANSSASLQFVDELPPPDTASGLPAPGMYRIAIDGCAFRDSQWQEVLAAGPTLASGGLASGNRMDFLVVAPSTTGTFMIEHQRTTENVQGNLTEAEKSATNTPLITVEVSGDALDWQLPATLPDLAIFGTTLKPIEVDANTKQRTLTFTQTGNQSGGTTAKPDGDPDVKFAPQFYIDGVQFDPRVVNQDPTLDTVEVWTIENTSQVKHPFHIHVNPFQIIETYGWDGTDYAMETFTPDTAEWWDTVALPVPEPMADATMPNDANPAYVKIASRFAEFTGEFVLHCHILGHEDRGMMQTVDVEPAS